MRPAPAPTSKKASEGRPRQRKTGKSGSSIDPEQQKFGVYKRMFALALKKVSPKKEAPKLVDQEARNYCAKMGISWNGPEK